MHIWRSKCFRENIFIYILHRVTIGVGGRPKVQYLPFSPSRLLFIFRSSGVGLEASLMFAVFQEMVRFIEKDTTPHVVPRPAGRDHGWDAGDTYLIR